MHNVSLPMPRLPGEMHPITPPLRRAPASAALAIPDTHPDAKALWATMTAIDSVHDDGGLASIPLVPSAGTREVGWIEFSRRTGKSMRIAVSSRGPHPELTLVHEVGHWLDEELLKSLPERRGPRRLLDQSGTSKELRRMARAGRTRDDGPRDLLQSDRSLLKGMAAPEEMFARFYSQWIAAKSRHPRLLAQLKRANDTHWSVYSFPPEEFNAILPEFEALFRKAGLL